MKPVLSAYEKAIDYLSRRDHSSYELQIKLRQKGFSSEEILEALTKIIEKGYLPNAQKLADKMADTLHRKLKGILYIQKYLKSKNLPSVRPDWDLELEKAQKLVHKSSIGKRYDKEKLYRYLINRGFAEQTIQKVIHEKR